MTQSNKNWPRWIFASISKHFNDAAATNHLPLYIEGQFRKPGVKDFLELRIDGPYITEISHNYFHLYLEVSVIVQSTMDATDYHRVHKSAGGAASIFTTIQLYKFGDGIDDDQSWFGCLDLAQDLGKHERIQINHFGQIKADTDLVQASVEGHYVTHLST